MLKVGICGIGGKMGKAILNALLDRGHSLGSAFEIESYSKMGEDAGCVASLENLDVKINPINVEDLNNTHGVIDFSNPGATMKLVDAAFESKKPLVIGTTGFSDEEKNKIEQLSKEAPVLLSPNMSPGVNVFFKLTEMASRVLGEDFDIEVFEAHHRFKIDAPSGTARKLLEIIKENAPDFTNASLVFDRTKKNEKRSDKEIGVQVLRGGDIVGEHTVHFAGMGERIELTHRASTREIFAKGAVAAFEYVTKKEPGLYNMFDVLGI